MRWLALLAVCTALSGCTPAKPTALSDGRTGQLIGCGGILGSTADCYQRAAQVCPHGYTIVSTAGSRTRTSLADRFGAVPRYLVIECRQPTPSASRTRAAA